MERPFRLSTTFGYNHYEIPDRVPYELKAIQDIAILRSTLGLSVGLSNSRFKWKTNVWILSEYASDFA